MTLWSGYLPGGPIGRWRFGRETGRVEAQRQEPSKGEQLNDRSSEAWNHPSLGHIPAPITAAAAERGGTSERLNGWVLERNCRDWLLWSAGRLPGLVDLSVNVSARRLMSPGPATAVSRVLDRMGMSASRLVLEMTESVLIEESNRAVRTLQELKTLGIRLALDNFGAGLGALNCLHRGGSIISEGVGVRRDGDASTDVLSWGCSCAAWGIADGTTSGWVDSPRGGTASEDLTLSDFTADEKTAAVTTDLGESLDVQLVYRPSASASLYAIDVQVERTAMAPTSGRILFETALDFDVPPSVYHERVTWNSASGEVPTFVDYVGRDGFHEGDPLSSPPASAGPWSWESRMGRPIREPWSGSTLGSLPSASGFHSRCTSVWRPTRSAQPQQ
ncbi:MAG: EAL domain-containing protein [Rhodoglobus sp.]